MWVVADIVVFNFTAPWFRSEADWCLSACIFLQVGVLGIKIKQQVGVLVGTFTSQQEGL